MQIQKAVESFQSETETKDDNKSDDENGETADLGPEDINQTASMIKGNCQNRVPAMSKTKICFIYIYKCSHLDLQHRFLIGRDSDTSSPFKKSQATSGTKPFEHRPSQIPPSDMRISPDAQEAPLKQPLQDVYPLAPQQWLVKKKSDRDNQEEYLLWNKGYPEMGKAEDTNEG